jgi:hypothetical protein
MRDGPQLTPNHSHINKLFYTDCTGKQKKGNAYVCLQIRPSTAVRALPPLHRCPLEPERAT